MPDAPDRRHPRLAAALDYLASFTDYEQLVAQAPARTTFDLGRLRRLLARFGSPEADPRPVVHVTGTKGKSSTVWMTDALLRAHGLRTFRFISPHVSSVCERLAVDDVPVSGDTFADLVDRLKPEIDQIRTDAPEDLPSFFEAITVMGFLLAREAAVDVSVLEVGLGGRLDATNVCHPTVCVISGVALDHTRILGNDIESIAKEKAGILKPGVPALLGFGPEHRAFATAAGRAEELQCPLAHPGAGLELDACRLEIGRDTLPRIVISGRTPEFAFEDLEVRAGAPVQAMNVLTSLEATRRILAERGRTLERPAVARALEELELPGRSELRPGPPRLVLDGAHTKESIEALLPLIDRLRGDAPIVLVCGLTRDRDPAAVFAPLRERVRGVVATALPTPRSRPASEVAEGLRALGLEPESLEDPAAALAAARDLATPDGLILITGSLYLVGALRPTLEAGRPGPGSGLPSKDERDA